jgi:hypothetical protein
MNVTGVSPHGQPSRKPARSRGARWAAPTVAGAAAFWLANLAISATPVAAGYRYALSIRYVPMLAEAAVGGLVLGGVLTFLLVCHASKIPGFSRLSKALLLGAVALVVVTIGIEAPSKLASGVENPAHWLLVATTFNLIRILALAVTIGLVADTDAQRRSRDPGRAEKGVRK